MNQPTQLLVTPPAEEPLTLDEARNWLRLPETADDDLLSSLIVAARTFFEDHDDRKLVRQRWRLGLNSFYRNWGLYAQKWAFYADHIVIPIRPLIEVESITYLDGDGVRQTLDRFAYQVVSDTFFPIITPAYNQMWPLARLMYDSVQITFLAGYADEIGGYSVALTPNWTTEYRIAQKTITGFKVYFSVGAPVSAELQYVAGGVEDTVFVSEGLDVIDVTFDSPAPEITAVIPEHLKKALSFMIGHLYENREATVIAPNMMEILLGYKALVGANRDVKV